RQKQIINMAQKQIAVRGDKGVTIASARTTCRPAFTLTQELKTKQRLTNESIFRILVNFYIV
ncbi:MAG: hypothetical protein ACK4IX_00550, partial [Candidatus Sericytochromatia bacterium]